MVVIRLSFLVLLIIFALFGSGWSFRIRDLCPNSDSDSGFNAGYNPTPNPASNSASDFSTQALNAHNYYRKLHGAPELKISAQLTQIAQSYAQVLAQRNVMQHSGRSGENLYMSFGMKPRGDQVTKAWYDENKFYDYKNGGFSMQTGHFTQVVWYSTKSVGFGIAQSASGSYFAVANYDPPGNYIGRFQQNVFPPQRRIVDNDSSEDDDDSSGYLVL